jgi:uncharacterized DUF497 family protein
MVTFEWNEEKNDALITSRGVSFRDVVEAHSNGDTIAIEKHPNPRYANQYLLIIKVHNYTHVVPFVITDHKTLFLKTIYPNRKKHKKHITHSNQPNETSE